ncbi:MAG: permease prefix domain 1-containing protein [Verrucomicrobiota bacterium]
METSISFSLTDALARWREELIASRTLSADEIRELETHLAEACADLQCRGLSAEEAFWLGQRRLGRPDQLAAEFAKLNPARIWRDRFVWLVAGVITSCLCPIGIGLFSTIVQNQWKWASRTAGWWVAELGGFALAMVIIFAMAVRTVRIRPAGVWKVGHRHWRPLGWGLVVLACVLGMGAAWLDARLAAGANADGARMGPCSPPVMPSGACHPQSIRSSSPPRSR